MVENSFDAEGSGFNFNITLRNKDEIYIDNVDVYRIRHKTKLDNKSALTIFKNNHMYGFIFPSESIERVDYDYRQSIIIKDAELVDRETYFTYFERIVNLLEEINNKLE